VDEPRYLLRVILSVEHPHEFHRLLELSLGA